MALNLIILVLVLAALYLIYRNTKLVHKNNSFLSAQIQDLQSSLLKIEKTLQNQEKNILEIQDEMILGKEALREINSHNKMTDVMLTKIKSDLAKVTSVTKK